MKFWKIKGIACKSNYRNTARNSFNFFVGSIIIANETAKTRITLTMKGTRREYTKAVFAETKKKYEKLDPLRIHVCSSRKRGYRS